MDYVIGSGLLLAAVLVLAVGRVVLGRTRAAADGETFGLGEAFALVFTVLLAFGISVLARRAIDDWSLASLALLAASLAVTAAAATGAWMLLGRLAGDAAAGAGAERPADTRAPETDRRGRPDGRQGQRAAGARRAA